MRLIIQRERDRERKEGRISNIKYNSKYNLESKENEETVKFAIVLHFSCVKFQMWKLTLLVYQKCANIKYVIVPLFHGQGHMQLIWTTHGYASNLKPWKCIYFLSFGFTTIWVITMFKFQVLSNLIKMKTVRKFL